MRLVRPAQRSECRKDGVQRVHEINRVELLPLLLRILALEREPKIPTMLYIAVNYNLRLNKGA